MTGRTKAISSSLMGIQERSEIATAGDVQAARRTIAALACGLGFDTASQTKLASLVTECGARLTSHGGSGELLVRPLSESVASNKQRYGIELLSISQPSGTTESPEHSRPFLSLVDEIDVWTAYSTQNEHPIHTKSNADSTAKRTRIPRHREQTGSSDAGALPFYSVSVYPSAHPVLTRLQSDIENFP